MIAEYLVKRWRNVIENQRFLLKQARLDVPDIAKAIGSDLAGIEKIAKIALAAEDAVAYRLPAKLRALFKNNKKGHSANGPKK